MLRKPVEEEFRGKENETCRKQLQGKESMAIFRKRELREQTLQQKLYNTRLEAEMAETTAAIKASNQTENTFNELNLTTVSIVESLILFTPKALDDNVTVTSTYV